MTSSLNPDGSLPKLLLGFRYIEISVRFKMFVTEPSKTLFGEFVSNKSDINF